MKKSILLISLLAFFNIFESTAHVKLLYPTGGETFVSGETITIEWSELANHNGTNWELYYSLDEGSTWITISDSIQYSDRVYAWTVPVEETINARIKVIQNNPGVNYEDESPDFTIENTTDVKQVQSSNQLFETLKIYPNPMLSVGNFSFYLNNEEYISFEFYSINGKMIDNIPTQQYLPGYHNINWNIKSIKSGLYVCIVKTKSIHKSYKLTVHN